MSREIPALPGNFELLADDVRAELLDFEHCTREHGERAAYQGGCRGPLCRRADRIWRRDLYARKRAAAGKPYEPSDLRRDARDDELDAALTLYRQHRKLIEVIVRLEDLYSEMERAI